MPDPIQRVEIPVSTEVLPRPNPKSRSLRAMVITSNLAKFKEFREVLGDGYGMDITRVDRDEQVSIEEQCIAIMKEAQFTPHFMLREETTLVNVDSNEDITHYTIDELASFHLSNVRHTSKLSVYKPQWQGEPVRTLSHFTVRDYEQRSYGYIDMEKRVECSHGFGWDSVFVNSVTNLSNEEFFEQFGKKSARQHTASDFIICYLRYKALVSLKHHEMPITKPIDFGATYIHLTQFIQNNPHLSNPFVNQWGVASLRNTMVNDGMFFKAAWSRAVKNFFSPPFSGLPLTAKQGAAEETIFGTHDMLHHAVPDLVCNAKPGKYHFQIYSAWRMISEACTLVLADMFYADGLIQNGVSSDNVDKRIHPLFVAVKDVQMIDDPTRMSVEDRLAFIKSLLFANMRFALHGDDSVWKQVLTQADGTILPEHQQRLDAYKNHFAKFFIGDNAWTRANFDNMNAKRASLDSWIDSVGEDAFRAANIPLLSDICRELGSDLADYNAVSEAVFEYVFTTRLKPSLERPVVDFDDDNLIQSRAFRRYLMGQVSLFSKYPTPLGLEKIKDGMLSRIQNTEPFTIVEQNNICENLKRYIMSLEGMRLMSRAEAKNAIDCFPVFPPVYISYPEMQEKYGTIERCVKEQVEAYTDPAARTAPHPNALFSGLNTDTPVMPPSKPSTSGLFKLTVQQPVIKKAIHLLGAPGVGKSTQTTAISAIIPGVMCISTGNLVRALLAKVEAGVAPLSSVEQEAARSLDIMKAGGLMDDKAVYALLMAHISEDGAGRDAVLKAHTIVFDGVLKEAKNVSAFNQALAAFNQANPNLVVHITAVVDLTADKEMLEQRHQSRVKEAQALKAAQRPDDSNDTYTKRLDLYMNNIHALLTRLSEEHDGIAYSDIDTSGGIEPTTRRLREIIEATTTASTLSQGESMLT
ncbi:MAG: nucleoside monophosphate kinase [Legionellaceae bacterium]|nr:nucleoside monophosphate kinase [Legionellaceae bacterium]